MPTSALTTGTANADPRPARKGIAKAVSRPTLKTCLTLGAALTLLACSGEPPPAAAPPPQPALTAAPAALPATADATAASDAGPPPVPTQSGRTPVLRSAESAITDTFGTSPAAKLELGDTEKAVLKIPENALDQGYLITFRVEPKGKSTGVPIGKIYRTMSQIAGQASFTKATTAGAPFELQLLAGNKKDANLAIGEILLDDKGREKISWSVIAPKKIDDTLGVAYFDLTFLGDAYLHVTAKPVTAAPASP